MQPTPFLDKRRPLPTDVFVYPVWKRYLHLKKEIVRNWVQDVVRHQADMRGFVDFQDCRLTIKGSTDFTPVISLKPFIGLDSHHELDFYITFFKNYRSICTKLLELLKSGVVARRYHYPDHFLTWREANQHAIHVYISVLRIMVIAAKHDKLDRSDLDLLMRAEDPTYHDDIDRLVRGYDIDHILSDKFAEGGHFYEHPYQEWVAAFWKHVSRLDKYSLNLTASYTSDGEKKDNPNGS